MENEINNEAVETNTEVVSSSESDNSNVLTETATETKETAQTESSIDWQSKLPEDLKDAAIFSKYKTEEDFYRGVVNLEKKLGSKGEDAPKSIEDYSYTLPENAPEQFQVNDEVMNSIKEVAQKNNIPAGVFEEMVNTYLSKEAEIFNSKVEEQAQQAEKEQQEIEQYFKETLGQDLDKYLENTGEVIDKFANEKDIEAIKSLSKEQRFALGNMMNNIHKAMQGERLTAGSQQNSIQSVQQQIESLRNDPNYGKHNDRGRKISEELHNLYIQAQSQGTLSKL